MGYLARPSRRTAARADHTVSSFAVTTVTVCAVASTDVRWLLLFVRLPAEPSRHRVAVWRELRRTGAVPLGQGSWAVPEAAGFTDGVNRAVEMAERGDGEVVVLSAVGRSDRDDQRLVALFTEQREEEWSEFIADCGKFDAEIDREIELLKFTVAELEEEEQSLERLRRWHRTIKSRDIFGAPSSGQADQLLKHCQERLADYTERVFAALHKT